VTEGISRNALLYARSDNGAAYCPKCAEDNPQHKYQLVSGHDDSKCDVCGKPPFIPKGTTPAHPLDNPRARIF